MLIDPSEFIERSKFIDACLKSFSYLEGDFDCLRNISELEFDLPSYMQGLELEWTNATTRILVSLEVYEQVPTVWISRVGLSTWKFNSTYYILTKDPTLTSVIFKVENKDRQDSSKMVYSLLNNRASTLREYASDVLLGDFRLFDEIIAKRTQFGDSIIVAEFIRRKEFLEACVRWFSFLEINYGFVRHFPEPDPHFRSIYPGFEVEWTNGTTRILVFLEVPEQMPFVLISPIGQSNVRLNLNHFIARVNPVATIPQFYGDLGKIQPPALRIHHLLEYMGNALQEYAEVVLRGDFQLFYKILDER